MKQLNISLGMFLILKLLFVTGNNVFKGQPGKMENENLKKTSTNSTLSFVIQTDNYPITTFTSHAFLV